MSAPSPTSRAGRPADPVIRSFLGVPIIDCGTILGAIYVANGPDGDEFTAEDERFLGILAAHAAIVLTRAQMFERDRELTLLQERSRIAQDLHDAVAQKLFSLRLTIGAVEALVAKGHHQRAQGEFKRMKDLAGAALEELRAVITELRPPALREDGLVPALRKHVAMVDRLHPVDIRITSNCDGRCELPEVVEDVVFRVAQEALHNAIRHAQPNVVAVHLEVDDGRVVLTVSPTTAPGSPRTSRRWVLNTEGWRPCGAVPERRVGACASTPGPGRGRLCGWRCPVTKANPVVVNRVEARPVEVGPVEVGPSMPGP